MTIVIKRIKGKEYCYYQTSLGTGQNPVTTYISKRQIDINKMSEG
jgi:hypothetical protein